MPPPPAPKPSLWTRLTGPLAVAVTAALSLLLIAWAVPPIRPWCLFFGVLILLLTLGGSLTVWLVSQPSPAPSSELLRERTLKGLRQQFVKSLEGAGGPRGRENPRDGTSAQTAYY
jgi:predicted small integral membrane protein